MPFNKKEKKIMASLRKTYGDRAENVFYASANTGKLGKAVKERHGSKKHKK